MGSGEPLDNYDNVLKFINIIHDENGHNISLRNITLSTCGIIPKIYELSKEIYLLHYQSPCILPLIVKSKNNAYC